MTDVEIGIRMKTFSVVRRAVSSCAKIVAPLVNATVVVNGIVAGVWVAVTAVVSQRVNHVPYPVVTAKTPVAKIAQKNVPIATIALVKNALRIVRVITKCVRSVVVNVANVEIYVVATV